MASKSKVAAKSKIAAKSKRPPNPKWPPNARWLPNPKWPPNARWPPISGWPPNSRWQPNPRWPPNPRWRQIQDPTVPTVPTINIHRTFLNLLFTLLHCVLLARLYGPASLLYLCCTAAWLRQTRTYILTIRTMRTQLKNKRNFSISYAILFSIFSTFYRCKFQTLIKSLTAIQVLKYFIRLVFHNSKKKFLWLILLCIRCIFVFFVFFLVTNTRIQRRIKRSSNQFSGASSSSQS